MVSFSPSNLGALTPSISELQILVEKVACGCRKRTHDYLDVGQPCSVKVHLQSPTRFTVNSKNRRQIGGS